MLAPRDLGGASQEENPDYQLQGLGPGREKARILFPRTYINRKFAEYGVPGRAVVRGDSIEVQVAENPDGAVDSSMLYFFNRKLELTQVVVSDSLKNLHRELETAGQLDHPLTGKEIAGLQHDRYLRGLAAGDSVSRRSNQQGFRASRPAVARPSYRPSLCSNSHFQNSGSP